MRKKICFNDKWKFFLGDLQPRANSDGWGGAKARAYSFGATAQGLNDSNWRTIDIPHDFVVEGDYTRKHNEGSSMQKIPEMESMDNRHVAGGSLDMGVAWYRKKFNLEAGCEDKRIYLYFDGVYRNSTVYINEYYVGSHSSGYSSFYFDITDFVNMNEENVIAIRVDASGREGWWYEGGGIYRSVWLEIADNIRIEPYGVFVSSSVDLETNKANLKIQTELSNKLLENKEAVLKTVIVNPVTSEKLQLEDKVLLNQYDNTVYTQEIAIDKAVLWSIETPNLYKLTTSLYLNGECLDEYEVNFGIRDIHFDANNGFFLNGKKVIIKGLCCHHDHAGVGIGMPDSVHEYRVNQMKKMGANAYRSSHNQPTEELLNICDRSGMLVLDEVRRMSSCSDDIEALRTMVKIGRNHPSVFLWGIGNEEIFSQHRPETQRTTVTMKNEVKKLDPTRFITSAVTCWDGKQKYDNAELYVDVTKHLDVMGFNYCSNAWDDYHLRMPNQPVIITEDSSNSGTRGCYSTDENTGRYYVLDPENENKCRSKKKAIKKDVGEKEWKYFAERPYLSGIFLWTGMDYRGEPTPLAYPAISSQFGIFDYCGFEKDNFYYYKSWWTDEPTLYVFPHWNFPDKDGEGIDVYCYSNLDEVELFVNKKSYGRKKVEHNWYLTWENVIYEPGELMAKGYVDGKEVMVDIKRTVLSPYKVQLSAYKAEVKVGETAIINIDVVDKNGDIVPTADNELYFAIDGAGKFLGTGNGNPGSHELDKVPLRRAFNGKCQLLVKASQEPGEIKITVTSDAIKKDVCIVKVI